eukprot:Rmarinus@m.26278
MASFLGLKGEQLNVFKVQRNQNKLEVKESPDLDGGVFTDCPLCHFASFSLDELGWVELPDPPENYSLEKFLASGYTSTVFQVTFDGNERGVLEVIKDTKDTIHEAAVLLDLVDIDGVPALVRERDDNKLYMTPCGTPSTHVSLDTFRSLVTILESVHKKGWCHRDLRLPNILVYGDRPLLIDWDFA